MKHKRKEKRKTLLYFISNKCYDVFIPIHWKQSGKWRGGKRREKEREKLINLLNFIESENELYIMFKKKLDKIEEWMCAE